MSVATDIERHMLDLINAERAALGIPPLTLELRLNAAAEDHSSWMIQANVLSHTGDNSSSPLERMLDADFEFSGAWSAGENVGYQSLRGAAGIEDDVEQIHVALMDSPGHRANILNPDFTVVGIGIEVGNWTAASGTREAVAITQNFAASSAPLQLDVLGSGSVVESEPVMNVIDGSNGDDNINGTAEMDEISTGRGNDNINSGAGDDFIYSGSGSDAVQAGAGNDRVSAKAGNDVVSGNDGDDELLGGDGRDFLWGDAGNDEVRGNEGRDRMFGGEGNDKLIGGSGMDRLLGEGGNDTLIGGGGADTFVFGVGDDQDRIKKFALGLDVLELDDALWSGTMTAQQVIANFGSEDASGTALKLDFGGGDVLTLTHNAGLDLQSLVDDIVIA